MYVNIYSVHFSAVRSDISKSIQYMRKLLCRQILRLMVSSIYSPERLPQRRVGERNKKILRAS